MDTFEWEDGTVVENPYVEIDGAKYYLQDGEYSGGTPVSAANLNAMQEILNQNVIRKLNSLRKVIWTNSNPTASFPSQTITLENSLENYDEYEILFLQSTTTSRIMTTGRIPVGSGTILNCLIAYPKYRPTGTVVNGATISFEDGRSVSSIGNVVVDNLSVIPAFVIGHKNNFGEE